MQTRLTRAEVPAELTWDLSDLFASAEDWEAGLKAVEADIATVTQYKGRLGESAAALLACLRAQEQFMEKAMRVFTYASLKNSEDGTNPVNQANSARIGALFARVGAAFAFMRTELLALPEGTVERFMAEEKELDQVFRSYLEDVLEAKPHTLSAETESALAALGEVLNSPSMTYSRSKSSDMQFDSFVDANGQTHPNSFAVYESIYDGHADTDLRRKAWDSFVKGLKPYNNTYAATFATEIKKNVVLAKIRKYESAIDMQLRPHKISRDVYENIHDIIQADLAPHFRRLARLRKRVLGVDKLLFCDLKVPLDPTFDPKITYAEACDLILEALSVMGPEYTKLMRNCLKERWCDLADNVGKSTGAFCSSPYGIHPYILMTWTDSMRDCYVLAHELGHAGHFGLAMRYQRLANLRPTAFFIEAPSTMNEAILTRHLLRKTTDTRMRRWVILQSLGTYHHNFITHLLEAELQRRLYGLAEAGKPITAKTLNETKGEILASFWGDELEIDDGARMTWMRQPHYYMGLYPYTYAAGLTASTAVSQLIFEEGQPAVDRWLQAIKSGGLMKPVELLQMAGVDMSKPEPIKKAVAYVGELVDELEQGYK